MTSDFVPVNPIANQDWLLIGIGQRYDVVFTANQTAGTYWFRAEAAASDCLSGAQGSGRALFTYSGQTVSEPTDDDEAAPADSCTELTTVPYWKQAVDSSTFADQVKTLDNTFGEGVSINGENLVLWALNTTSMSVHWDNPTLQYVFDGNTSYPAELDVIEIPTEGTWTYWVIQEVTSAPAIPHPIHLHGHDFFVLGSGTGQFDASTQTSDLNFDTPPRRDTTTLPAGGWLVIAFSANNPGAWLMHCHIAWHISEGLGVQFLEAKDSITMPDQTQFESQCSNWKTYAATMLYPQIDSGI
jgi:FtsP/CotA-like multicopper oxidase with cupredoxin domain